MKLFYKFVLFIKKKYIFLFELVGVVEYTNNINKTSRFYTEFFSNSSHPVVLLNIVLLFHLCLLL